MGAKKENTYENYVHADASGSSNAMKMYLKEKMKNFMDYWD